MHPAPVNGDPVVHFNNEAERIARHLSLVREELVAHPPQGLNAKAAARRSFLLGELDTYAHRGVFPQNHHLEKRNPVFIDEHNTACAVGQLMIQGGDGQLAHKLHDEMNLAFVHDMKRDDVNEWAAANGFTENELAWIQPSYPPNLPWAALGDGTNGPVSELLRLGNGDLIVAGDFTTAGGVNCTRVARWDGTMYHAMGAPMEGQVTCSIEFGGSIYLGGSFGGGVYDLLQWNGTMWIPSAAFASKYAQVTALHAHNGSLYAGGSLTGFAGTSYGVMHLVGSNWQPIGQQFNGAVHALESLNGQLVCAGAFTGQFASQDTTLLHVALLSGNTWQQLADGLNGTVYDLLMDGDHLYAGGNCVSEINLYFGMARITSGASTWEQMMPNIGWYLNSPVDALVSIYAMEAHNGRIYFGGDFGITTLMTYGFGLGYIDGVPDAVNVYGNFNSGVKDLDLIGSSTLVAGGDFVSNGGLSVPYVASLDLATSIPNSASADGGIRVWPVPAVDRITVSLPEGPVASVSIIDATGREVRALGAVKMNASINVADLAPGTYTLRALREGKTYAVPFLKR